MAKPLDLEEQEQLDELKHFWKSYGNLITWALIVVFGGIAAWNGWQYWQRTQAAQASAAKTFADKGNVEAAKAALGWVADKSSDEGYQATARLRLAGILADSKAYDEALKQLSGGFPPEFEGLVADRRGDIYNLQGKKAEARTEYLKAWRAIDERVEYRRLVEVKLTALGVDPKADASTKAATVAASAPAPASVPAIAASAGVKP
jgi:predicted negative regulator of RcsB-dependent stress response